MPSQATNHAADGKISSTGSSDDVCVIFDTETEHDLAVISKDFRENVMLQLETVGSVGDALPTALVIQEGNNIFNLLTTVPNFSYPLCFFF